MDEITFNFYRQLNFLSTLLVIVKGNILLEGKEKTSFASNCTKRQVFEYITEIFLYNKAILLEIFCDKFSFNQL